MLIPVEKPVLPVPLTTMENPATTISMSSLFIQTNGESINLAFERKKLSTLRKPDLV
jgi:hypothetical protein